MTQTALAAESPAAAPVRWRNRIIGVGEEAPDQLCANPRNFRIHPKGQQDAMEAVLDQVGFVQHVIVNQRTGFVVDGHLRVSIAISRDEPKIPVVYVDLSDDEEQLILTTFDPIGAMAGTDREKLAELLGAVQSDDARMRALLEDIRSKQLDLAPAAEPADNEPSAARVSLAEQFGVPPFSVLDARQGYWQDRKRAWLALGIKSELGRGELGGFEKQGAVMPIGGNVKQCLLNKGEAQKAGRGLAKGLADRRQRAKQRRVSPGGSPRPAAKLGKNGLTTRGDGKGRALRKAPR